MTPRARSVTDLDPGVSTRQAFGASYGRPEDLQERLETYRAGVLRLSPHPDWEGDFADWSADPFSDRNWQFQHHTLIWINTLRWAALEGDAEAKAEWTRIVRSWFEANVPAHNSFSPFAWKDMADGNRAIQLSLGVPLVDRSDAWFVELLEYHRDWLMDPEHIVGKNHGLHQHAGLLVVGAALRDRTAMDTATDRMRKQFLTTFDEQGTNDEGSVAYQQLNLRWWRHAWDRAKAEGYTVPSNVAGRLDAGANVLAHLSLPDGRMPQIGDTSRGSVGRGIGTVTDFVASRGKVGQKPAETAIALDGGYIVSRSGWGEKRPIAHESHMILRHGIDLKAHSHDDRGSLHIYAGARWLVDSGFHSYQSNDPTRLYLNSREAHNIAFLPGVAHDSTAPVELVDRSITQAVHDFTVIDRGYQPEDVRRRVLYFPEPDCWIVLDSADSPDGAMLTQHWHLEPGTECWYRDRGFRLRQGAKTMTMTWLGTSPRLRYRKALDGDLAGWVGTRWKTLEPGGRITAESPRAKSGRQVTMIASNAPSPFGIVDSRVTMNGDVTVSVLRGGKAWNLSVTQDGAKSGRM